MTIITRRDQEDIVGPAMASFLGHPGEQKKDKHGFPMFERLKVFPFNESIEPSAVPKVCGRLPSYRQQLGTADGPGERHPGQPGAE